MDDVKLIKQLKQYRDKFEARWYISSAFYDGFHFSWGKQDKDGNWIQTPTPKGKVLRQIPKAKKHINNIRNMLLKVKMRPVVYPDKNVIYGMMNDPDKMEAEKEKALRLGRYVEYTLMEELKLLKYRKRLIKNAELMSHGFIQILTEGDELALEVYDAFDISVPYGTDTVEDVAVKHIAKQLSDIKENEEYNKEVIKKLESAVAGKYSESKFKDAMMAEKYGNAPEDLILLDELYKIEDDKVVVRTYAGEEMLREQKTNLTKIPISMFVWDDECYQTSLMEDLIPLNRVYDVFISKLEHKVKKLDTGRIVLQAREPAKVITTNDGEIIRYKHIKPDVMEESQLSQSFFLMLENVEKDLKEQGVSMATGASVPSGVKAWRAIESLKESDYASIGNQTDNLQDCLADLTEKLIDILSSNIKTSEIVQIPKGNGESELMKVVGREAAESMSNIPEDTLIIDPNSTVKVEMESQLSWTEVGKRDIIIELVGAGLLPTETAVKMLEVGNTQEILKQMQIEITKGKSIIDMPDFKLLPKDLQMAILQYLSTGGVINDPNANAEDVEEAVKGAKNFTNK